MADQESLSALDEKLKILRTLVNTANQPNFSTITAIAKDLDFIKLNIKFFGYDLAKRLAEAIPPRENLAPLKHDLTWKPTTQADLESDWAAYSSRNCKLALFITESYGKLHICCRLSTTTT